MNCKDLGDIKSYKYISDIEVVTKKISDMLDDKELAKYNIKDKNLQESKRDYNSITFNLEDRNLTIFYTGIPFIKELSTGKWYYTESATTTIDAFDKQMNSLAIYWKAEALYPRRIRFF